MKFATRLLGSAAALAATARSVIEDESSGARADAQPGPDDEEEVPDEEEVETGQKQTGAAATGVAPAGGAEAAAPAPKADAIDGGASAEVVLTPGELNAFAAGADSRNADIAEVFSARAEAAEGEEGELLVVGREAAAAELLAEGLTAKATIKMLGKLPKGEQGNAMLENLRTQAGATPKSTPAGGDNGGSQGGSVWDRVSAKKGWGKAK